MPRNSYTYDTEEKSWQHLNFFQRRCYLHVRVPRMKDAVNGHITQVHVPWTRQRSGFTLLFNVGFIYLIVCNLKYKLFTCERNFFESIAAFFSFFVY
ncbi:MAG: transposase family protein [Dysgonamonadaceae bacterium]|nr:transposase family protein [Dysgonamonadaceae bacterium]